MTGTDRPPIDAAVVVFSRDVSPEHRGEVLLVEASYVVDRNDVGPGGLLLHPAGVKVQLVEGVPAARSRVLERAYRGGEEAPRRVPAAEVEARASRRVDIGATGVAYDEAVYEDQIEALVDHARSL